MRPAQRLVEIERRETGKLIERREIPTLADHPLLAGRWLDGMQRLGLGSLVADTD